MQVHDQRQHLGGPSGPVDPDGYGERPGVQDLVDQPHPGPGEVVVRVVVAATNPGELMIREGAFSDVWPATFPEGQGNDFSGRVAEVGAGETRFSPGDEVIGFAPRRAQADFVVSASDRLARRPPGVRGRSRPSFPLLARPPTPRSGPST